MSCELPATMVDVSDFRQVPDTQEVYNDVDTSATVIVELLSRQRDLPDDKAAEFFYKDLASANGCDAVADGVQLEFVAPLPPSAYPRLAHLPTEASQQQQQGAAQVCAHASLACGIQRIAKYTNETGKENDVFVGLVVLRFLPPVSTEVLLSLSAPARLHPDSSDAKSCVRLLTVDERMTILRHAVASLAVHDWGLFVPEE